MPGLHKELNGRTNTWKKQHLAMNLCAGTLASARLGPQRLLLFLKFLISARQGMGESFNVPLTFPQENGADALVTLVHATNPVPILGDDIFVLQ